MSSFLSNMERPFSAILNATVSAPSANPLPLNHHVFASEEDVWTSVLAVYVSTTWILQRLNTIIRASTAYLVCLKVFGVFDRLISIARIDMEEIV